MRELHPSSADLERFLGGQLSREESNLVVDHLLAECPTCQEITGKGWARISDGLRAARSEPPTTDRQESSVAPDSRYQASLSRALGHAVGVAHDVERSRVSAERRYEELVDHPQKRRLTLIRNSDRFQTAELCELLMEKGYDQRFSDAHLGVALTELAVVVGQHLNDESLGPERTRDLVGTAWAYHGNALRVTTDLRGADKAFVEADRCFQRGLGADEEKALLCRFQALLWRARREFEKADALQDRAIRMYLRQGENRRAAFVLADQALGHLYRGELERAIQGLERALEIFNDIGEAEGIAQVRHNLALCQAEMGLPREALESVSKVRPLLQGFGDTLSLIRLRWLEARILLDLEHEGQAEKALVDARDAFAAQSIGYDAALVSLDLAMLYCHQGRSSEIRELAEQMVPIFQSRDVHREALAALMIFREAALAESVSIALIEQIGTYLQVARNDPKLVFRLS